MTQIDQIKSLSGKTVLVTGASRGIGEAIAKAFALAGATVVGTATTASGADAIACYLSQYDNPGGGQVMKLGEDGSIEEAFEQVTERYGAPAVLINNAGVTRDNLFLRMKESDWEEVIDVNLMSVLKLTKRALRPMVKSRWGRIINISSVVARLGNGGQVNYAAAKAGLEGVTRSLAKEVGSRGITVNAIAPGYIATDMTSSLTDEQRARLTESIPLSRMGSAEDIAHAALFLASSSADYITGATLPVNGGLYMS